jgi:hypothetical protein
MPALFEPPEYLEGPRVSTRPHPGNRIMRFYRPRPVGHSVWKVDGEWHEGTFPSAALTKTAEQMFLGGHPYVVSDDVADELEALGYTVIRDPFSEEFIWGGDASSGSWSDFIWGGDATGASGDELAGGDSSGGDSFLLGGDASSVHSDEVTAGNAATAHQDYVHGGDA